MADTLGTINPIRYRSYYYDNETGFYYLNSRYYDPDVKRFINSDSYISTGDGIFGTNMFAYCMNNPVKYIDPSGAVVGVDDAIYLIVAFLIVGTAVVASASMAEVSLSYSYPTDGTGALKYIGDGPPNLRLLPPPEKEPPGGEGGGGGGGGFKRSPVPNPLPDRKGSDSREKPSAKYYEAYLMHPGIWVLTTSPMDASKAARDVLFGLHVCTPNEMDAIALAIYVSGGYESGNNERKVKAGQDAYHYHLKNRITTAHIFYGFQAVEFIGRC